MGWYRARGGSLTHEAHNMPVLLPNAYVQYNVSSEYSGHLFDVEKSSLVEFMVNSTLNCMFSVDTTSGLNGKLVIFVPSND